MNVTRSNCEEKVADYQLNYKKSSLVQCRWRENRDESASSKQQIHSESILLVISIPGCLRLGLGFDSCSVMMY